MDEYQKVFIMNSVYSFLLAFMQNYIISGKKWGSKCTASCSYTDTKTVPI